MHRPPAKPPAPTPPPVCEDCRHNPHTPECQLERAIIEMVLGALVVGWVVIAIAVAVLILKL